MDTADLKQTQEREFFRINDELELSYYVIPEHLAPSQIKPEDYEPMLFDGDSLRHFQLMQQLRELDRSASDLSDEMGRTQATVYHYCKLLSTKMELIAHSLHRADQRPLQQANLSMGGVAFYTQEELKPGQNLKLKVILRPSYYGFLCSANVMNVTYLPKVDAERPFKVGVKFFDINDADQTAIHQHATRRQIESSNRNV